MTFLVGVSGSNWAILMQWVLLKFYRFLVDRHQSFTLSSFANSILNFLKNQRNPSHYHSVSFHYCSSWSLVGVSLSLPWKGAHFSRTYRCPASSTGPHTLTAGYELYQKSASLISVTVAIDHLCRLKCCSSLNFGLWFTVSKRTQSFQIRQSAEYLWTQVAHSEVCSLFSCV